MTFRTITDLLRFPEGPISLPDGDWLCVEIAGKALTRIHPDGSVTVVAELEGGPNGAALGPDGWVYICNSGGWLYERRGELTWSVGQSERNGWIERVHLQTGEQQTLYTHCGDIALRSPNDLVFDQHGGFYFTDLGKRGNRTIDWCGVFYAAADGSSIREVVHPMITPNGCGLSPDGNELYVAETLTGRLWAFEVTAPGVLAPGTGMAPHKGRLVAGVSGYRLFDSMAVHDSGLVCVATLWESGITVCHPNAGEVAFVPMPDTYTTNLCFDAQGRDLAYVTLSSTGRLVEIPTSLLLEQR
jgi:gluconolactonase